MLYPCLSRSFRTMADRFGQSAPEACTVPLQAWLEHNRAATDPRSTSRARVCHNGLSLRTTSWSEQA